MNANYSREVRLSGEVLERARNAERDVISSLNTMGNLILEAMEGQSGRKVNVEKDAKVVYGVSARKGVPVLCIHGPEYCYCYDSVTGVCRPCTPDEETLSA